MVKKLLIINTVLAAMITAILIATAVNQQPRMVVDYGNFAVYEIDSETPTVWSCCKDYYGECLDVRTVLPYVKEVNNLDDRYTVHRGQLIHIPEYHWE